MHVPGVATKPKPSKADVADEAAALKAELYRICKGKDNGLKASEADTQQVLAIAEKLAKLNQVRRVGGRAVCGYACTKTIPARTGAFDHLGLADFRRAPDGRRAYRRADRARCRRRRRLSRPAPGERPALTAQR